MTARNSNRVMWQTALIWAVSLFVVPFAGHKLLAWINMAANYSMDPSFGGYFMALLIALPAGGALAAYLTIRLIRQETGLPARALVPAVAWAVAVFLAGFFPIVVENLLFLSDTVPVLAGAEPEPYSPPFAQMFATRGATWLLAGLVGGWGIAIGLRAGGMPAGWRSLGRVSLSWGAAFALAGAMVYTGINMFFWFALNGRDLGWLFNESMLWAVYGITGLLAAPAAVLSTLAIARQSARGAGSGTPGDQLDAGSLGPVQL